MQLSHIGVAVTDLDEAVLAFATVFGYDPDCYEEVADQKIKTAIFGAGESRVELLVGTAPDSPIAKYIEKRGAGIQHMALKVDDIEKELARLKQAGVRLIDETPRRGAEGALIAFIHPKSTAGILVELQQTEK